MSPGGCVLRGAFTHRKQTLVMMCVRGGSDEIGWNGSKVDLLSFVTYLSLHHHHRSQKMWLLFCHSCDYAHTLPLFIVQPTPLLEGHDVVEVEDLFEQRWRLLY